MLANAQSQIATSGRSRMARRVTFSHFWPMLCMFLFGIGWAIAIEVQFRIYAAELVVLASLPFLRLNLLFQQYSALGRITWCFALWILAIFVSDIYNQSDIVDLIKASSTPLLAAASLVFSLACITRSPGSLLVFFIGMAGAKLLLGEPFYGTEWASRDLAIASLNEINYFKARVEPFLTPALLVFLVWIGYNNPRNLIFPACVIGLFYILLDSRSVGLTFLASACLFAMATRKRRLRISALTAGVFLTLVALYPLYVLYVDFTIQGNIGGQTGQQLARTENPYNPLELLLIGRSEWTVLPTAIAERPIMGWGSWATDPGDRFFLLRTERSNVLNSSVEQLNGVRFIPAHSVFGATWMWSGLLGLAAMIALAVNVVRLLRPALSHRTSGSFLAMYLFASMAWAFLFSPPQSARTQFPVAIALLIILSHPNGRVSYSSIGSRSKVGAM